MSPPDLLNHLMAGGTAAERAWKQFLEDYSNLFLKVIWQFEKDRDKVMDTYLIVCSKFAAQNFAILRKFKHEESEDPPKFTTWLGAVVRNMCIDVYRMEHGRRRYPQALMGLTAFDRKVFQLYFWKGHTVTEIEAQVGPPRKSRVSESLRRIERQLTKPPRSARPESTAITIVPLDENIAAVDEPNGEHELRMELLEEWLSRLAPKDRLIVRLRFWENMTAKEISGTIRTTSESEVYGIVRKAIGQLRKHAARSLRNE